jgi:hypothetical protein
MDVKSEIIAEFEEALLARNSCTPAFVTRLCDLIRAKDSMSQDELMSLIENEPYDKH